MNNTKKIVTFAVLSAMPIIANAGYMAYYPLEVKLGGSLPDGSINIGTPTNPTDPTEPTDPSSKCEYDSGKTMIVEMKTASGPFKPGDMLLLYKGNLLGSFGPSGGTPLNGVTPGKQMTDLPTSAEFEICGSNLGSYPIIPFPVETPTDPTGPTEPNGNCEYDGMSKLAMFKVANGPFAAGDVLLLYRGKLIGAQSPSNGLDVPAGITSGQIKLDTPEVAEAEICGDNLSSYPKIPIPTGTPPVDDNAITFTDTITSNSCLKARAQPMGSCWLDGAHVNQHIDLQLDGSQGIIIYTDFLSPEDRAKLSTATTISTNTGKSCLIDKIYQEGEYGVNGVGCYNKTLILESDFGSTITFTIK